MPSYREVRRETFAPAQRIALRNRPRSRFPSPRARIRRSLSTTVTLSKFFAVRAQHRRPPISMFSTHLSGRHPAFARGRLKRIQIHHHQINRRDSVFFRAASGLPLPRRRAPACTFGWSVFTSRARMSGPARKSETSRTATPAFAQQYRRRSARRENLELQLGQPLRKFHTSRFVKHADETLAAPPWNPSTKRKAQQF